MRFRVDILRSKTDTLKRLNRVAAYYAKKRSEGKPHRVVITHVAKKLVRVIYALEKQNTDFAAQALR